MQTDLPPPNQGSPLADTSSREPQQPQRQLPLQPAHLSMQLIPRYPYVPPASRRKVFVAAEDILPTTMQLLFPSMGCFTVVLRSSAILLPAIGLRPALTVQSLSVVGVVEPPIFTAIAINGDICNEEWIEEASLWARMTNENLIRCWNTPLAFERGGLFLVTVGVPLATKLDPLHPLSDVDVMRIVVSMCNAVLYLWGNDFHVGYDLINPQSILLHALQWCLPNGLEYCGEHTIGQPLPPNRAIYLSPHVVASVDELQPYEATLCVALQIMKLTCCLCTEQFDRLACRQSTDYEGVLRDQLTELPALTSKVDQRYSRPGSLPFVRNFVKSFDLPKLTRFASTMEQTGVNVVQGLHRRAYQCLTDLYNDGWQSILI